MFQDVSLHTFTFPLNLPLEKGDLVKGLLRWRPFNLFQPTPMRKGEVTLFCAKYPQSSWVLKIIPATAFPGCRRALRVYLRITLSNVIPKTPEWGRPLRSFVLATNTPHPAEMHRSGFWVPFATKRYKRKVDANRLGKSRVVARRSTVDRRTFKENFKKGLASITNKGLAECFAKPSFLSVTEGRFSESRSFVFRASLWPRASWAA